VLTSVLIVLLVLVTVAYAAVPLLSRRAVDPVPDERDPLVVDLEEERDALLRAIRELDARTDLPAARRDALRARYEAKAAQVLRALEEQRGAAVVRPQPARPTARRQAPWGVLGLLGIVAVTAATLGTFVLPRVGQGSLTTSFDADLQMATALRDLQREADRSPSVGNLMALGDAYWALQDAAAAEETYRRVLTVAEADATGGAPALAFKRLALLAVQTDLPAARDLLAQARLVDPLDPETLYALGELSFALDDLEMAADAFDAYLATPEGAGDPAAVDRLALIEAIGPASQALAETRSEANLMALADVYWSAGAQDTAVELYFEVLTDFDPREATALARTGQLLFVRGRNDDAIAVLERAAEAAGALDRLEPQATLFLGNAYAVAGDDAAAVRAWEAHVASVGADAAGRVTGLIEAAQARLAGAGTAVAAPAPAFAAEAGDAPAGAATAVAALEDPALLLEVGATLYAANCSVCHGSSGQGGTGPRLTDNARAANEANVRSLVTFGRGIMPGFGATLADAEIEVLVRWVGQELAAPR
jgi:mono/diheme cytochrome c family protein